MTIKNIIFDLGGVILNIDSHKTIEAFKALGTTNAEGLFINNRRIIDEFSQGLIDADAFRETMMNKFKIGVSDQMFDHAWNAMLHSPSMRNADIK